MTTQQVRGQRGDGCNDRRCGNLVRGQHGARRDLGLRGREVKVKRGRHVDADMVREMESCRKVKRVWIWAWGAARQRGSWEWNDGIRDRGGGTRVLSGLDRRRRSRSVSRVPVGTALRVFIQLQVGDDVRERFHEQA
jgi:hypothetical protein